MSRGLRFEQKSKQRRYNRLLNIFIGIVLVLIAFVGGSLLFGGKDREEAGQSKPAATESNTKSSSSERPTKDSQKNSGDEKADEKKSNEDDAVSSEEDEENTDNLEPADGESDVTADYGSDPNVIKAYTANWQPVPTKQSEPHVTTYEKGSVDWQEIETAASYATGIPLDDMRTWWVANSKPSQGQGVIVTITPSDESQVYDVELIWVENEGWKPVVVKQLKENYRKG